MCLPSHLARQTQSSIDIYPDTEVLDCILQFDGTGHAEGNSRRRHTNSGHGLWYRRTRV